MTTQHYDLVIVGAGSGNIIVDEQFDDFRVALVERGPFGGTCLNRGCIPSKMFILPADVATTARRGDALGVPTRVGPAEWRTIRDRVIAKVDADAADGLEGREEADNIDVYQGTASFTGPRTLAIDVDGKITEVTGDQVVLATGTRPVVPDIPGLEEAGFETSDTIMRLEAFPARLGVVGGGYVGSELAHVFSSYGAEVVQVEGGDSLLNDQDADVAAHFTSAVERRWDVRLGTELEKVSGGGGDPITLHLADGEEAEVDVLLLAIGRQPNSDLLDLERAGVDVDDSGRIVVDEHQRTSADGVWSLGDASSDQPLKHVANQDARVVQHNLLRALRHTGDGPSDLAVSDHRAVPQAVFTHPQIARVGLTEAEARDEHGDDVVVARHDVADVAYGWALAGDLDDDAEANGFVKLVGRRSTGRLVGAHLVAPMASVLVQPLVMAMAHDVPVAGLARSTYWIHPALTEVVENALIALESALESAPDDA
ncbi:mycothione reductase [Nocardioides hwasunensis]|uniref:Mycothione reductase n=1 Tax=Nocardioides hwasunensis TaxID=397258 RepID=A0ABR8MHY7_9ACTN|nr:mycothione reductase [Nocardioides hwasunensis]MBD3915671.1 mycothione reductase [Nocardioides hwasunensis]